MGHKHIVSESEMWVKKKHSEYHRKPPAAETYSSLTKGGFRVPWADPNYERYQKWKF